MSFKVLCIAHSKNRKTGDIAQTYTQKGSCPVRCPFNLHGCYGQQSFTNFQWNRAEVDGILSDSVELRLWVVDNTEEGALLRHNVAGDICITGTNDIDEKLVSDLCNAFSGRRAYTYTHAEINERNAKIVREAQEKGFLINFSCETVEEVDKALSLGCMAVLTVTKPVETNAKTPDGWRIVQCPSQTHNDVTCKTCELCARVRGVVMAFETHGSKKELANRAIEQKITIYR